MSEFRDRDEIADHIWEYREQMTERAQRLEDLWAKVKFDDADLDDCYEEFQRIIDETGGDER